MRLTYRSGLGILLLVWLVVAPRPGKASEEGEIWVVAQNTNELKILLGMGGIETVVLPAGAAPHTINFSPDGSYAYVSNVGNGDLIVVRAEDRQIVATINLGPTFTHDTKSSPDGSILLAVSVATRMVTKIVADEDAETWTVVEALDVGAVTGRAPVCVAFRSDGARAYVSLMPSGIAVVDVHSMTVLGTLPTVGGVACGFVNSKDGRTIFVDSNGGTGHFYWLDTWTDTLFEGTGYGPIGADIHGMATSANEKRAFIATRGADEVKVLDLNGTEVNTIVVDPRPGIPDAPDSMARRGSTLYVTLRFAGQVARIKTQSGTVDFIDVAPPATSGYAVHGIAVRP